MNFLPLLIQLSYSSTPTGVSWEQAVKQGRETCRLTEEPPHSLLSSKSYSSLSLRQKSCYFYIFLVPTLPVDPIDLPDLFPALHSLLYPSTELLKAIPLKLPIQFNPDLHLSFHSSRPNHTVPSLALQNTFCGIQTFQGG